MTLNNFKLKTLIILSKTIPKEHKKELVKRLIKKDSEIFSWGDGETNKIKNLYSYGMSARAYDIFITSIYALMENNEISLHTLLRSQMENIFFTNYFIKNPKEIRHSLKEKFYKPKSISDFRKSMENDEFMKKYHRMLSWKTHPFSEGLKSCFGSMYALNWKTMKWHPIFVLKDREQRISEKDRKIAVRLIIDFFDKVKENLDVILKICPNYKIGSYKVTHKKPFKEYFT